MLYTYVIRYHHYSGNKKLESSFKEFFGRMEDINTVLYPVHLEPCLKALRIESEEYIKNHSVLPYYKVFMKQEVYESICKDMLYGTKAYTSRLKSNQHHVTKTKCNRLFYCPVCLSEDMCYENIKIYHQLNEVHACTRHKCYLNSVPIKPYKKLLYMEDWNMEVRICENEPVLLQTAQDVEYIIENQPELNNDILRACLLEEAIRRRIYKGGSWNENIDTQWKSFYDNLPVEYNIYKNNLYFNKFASRRSLMGVDAVEYLLFIQSLFGSFERFVEICL